MNYRITPIPALKDNYIWAITHEQKTLIVDPGVASPVFDFLAQTHTELVGILLSHHHWDHTNGVAELTHRFDVPVLGSATDSIAGLTQPLKEGDEAVIADFPLTFTVLSIPGHTLGHIAFYANRILFSGDTLFAAGCGRLFEGTAEQLYASLQKMAALPDNTRIYCGHEYTESNLRFAAILEPSNDAIKQRLSEVQALRMKNQPTLPSYLADEKATNPYLRSDSAELIANVETFAGQPLTNPVDVFRWTRKWKDSFS